MKPSDLDLLANRLSNDIATDEKQLDDLGAAVFTTAKLIEMRGRYQERLDQFDFWHGRLMKAAMWSPIFVPVGGTLLWLGALRSGFVILAMFPVVLMVALTGAFSMLQKFGGRRTIEARLEDIGTELQNRQQEAEAKRKKL